MTAEENRQLTGIINVYNLAEKYQQAHGLERPLPHIAYRPIQSGRAYQSAAWQVYQGKTRTDDAERSLQHWRDYGHKTFDIFERAEKAPRLADAIAWATQRYGISDWTKGPSWVVGEAWFPAAVVAWAVEVLKEAKRRAKVEV